MITQKEIKFLKSVLSDSEVSFSIEQIVKWVKDIKSSITFEIDQIPLNELKQWKFTENYEKLAHISGKFYSIDGIRVETNYGIKSSWEQPIINQPEIGFLGILTQMKNGILHFLLQAKIEPGNINLVQLSPTLQATKSNYSRVHKGSTPAYLEYFNGEKKVQVLVDQLQSEQGARFLKKRNRNIIVEIPEDERIEVLDNFIWVTLKQIKELMINNNLVNMDTRTVISSINYGRFKTEKDFIETLRQNDIPIPDEEQFKYLISLLQSDRSLYNIEEILSWMTALKSHYELNVEKINLQKVKDWHYDGNTISHNDGKYFSVIGALVKIGNREVQAWDQPMIKPAQEGIIGFIVKKINGVFHFLVQAKVEIGNFDVLEIAPTVQCLTGNYRENINEYSVSFVNDFLHDNGHSIIHRSLQSEEGGRFYKEQNLNMIIEVTDSFPNDLPPNYFWMTYSQLLMFMKFNNYLNIATRSLISLIPFNL